MLAIVKGRMSDLTGLELLVWVRGRPEQWCMPRLNLMMIIDVRRFLLL